MALKLQVRMQMAALLVWLLSISNDPPFAYLWNVSYVQTTLNPTAIAGYCLMNSSKTPEQTLAPFGGNWIMRVIACVMIIVHKKRVWSKADHGDKYLTVPLRREERGRTVRWRVLQVLKVTQWVFTSDVGFFTICLLVFVINKLLIVSPGSSWKPRRQRRSGRPWAHCKSGKTPTDFQFLLRPFLI